MVAPAATKLKAICLNGHLKQEAVMPVMVYNESTAASGWMDTLPALI